jgi:hypothetical protein
MSVTLPTQKIKSLLNYELFLLYDVFSLDFRSHFHLVIHIHPRMLEGAFSTSPLKVTFLFNGAPRSAAPQACTFLGIFFRNMKLKCKLNQRKIFFIANSNRKRD